MELSHGLPGAVQGNTAGAEKSKVMGWVGILGFWKPDPDLASAMKAIADAFDVHTLR